MNKENFERNMDMFARRANGETYVEIGERYGVTAPRVRQIVTKMQRRAEWLSKKI